MIDSHDVPNAPYKDIEKQFPQGQARVSAEDIGTKQWMSKISDNISVCELSIPGSHDSAAYTYGLPFIVTQNLNIVQQLDAGIRYLDLRCGLRKDVLEMVHGPQRLGLTFEEVLEVIYGWLDANETEGLIVQLKKDRDDEESSTTFIQAVMTIIARNSDQWRTANTTPRLGELRGKMQLLRRFRGEDLTAYGLNVSRWQDNPKKPFTMKVGHGIRVTVQDHYRYEEALSLPTVVAQKGHEIAELLQMAQEDISTNHWYINFTSALEFNWRYQYPPRKIAQGGWYGFTKVFGVNAVLLDRLQAIDGKVRLGIVAMDFPNLTAGLNEAIISTNFDPTDHKQLRLRTLTSIGVAIIFLLILMLVVLTYGSQAMYLLRIMVKILDQACIEIEATSIANDNHQS